MALELRGLRFMVLWREECISLYLLQYGPRRCPEGCSLRHAFFFLGLVGLKGVPVSSWGSRLAKGHASWVLNPKPQTPNPKP